MSVPSLLSPDECQALARRVLEMVDASRAQVEVGNEINSRTRFARGDTHLASETVAASVTLDLEVGGDRHATGSTNRLDDAGLRALVREVEALTREQRTRGTWTEDDDFRPFLPPQVYPVGPQTFFDATHRAMSGEVQADVLRRAADAADGAGLTMAGDVTLHGYIRAVLNTRGLWACDRSTYGEFSLTARTKDGTGSGWAWSGYEDWARVQVDDVIRRAIDLGRRSANPVAVEPGRYTVILEPAAVAMLIGSILSSVTAWMSAAAADDGNSVFSKELVGTNKIGLQMIDRRLNLVSDPWDPERPASTIGSELGAVWRPLAPVTWFEKGVLRNLSYWPSYARQQGRDPLVNPGGLRLTAEGPSQTLEEMIASTKRGIWVNRFSHGGVINGMTLLLSGVTRDGTFLIENGKITKAIKNFRFMESSFFVLNQLDAAGEPVRAGGNIVAPRLKVRDFNFTSLTDSV